MSILRRIRWGRVSLALLSVTAFVAVIDSAPEEQDVQEIQAIQDIQDITVTDEIMKPNTKLLLDRPWIDHLPSNDKDLVNAMFFIERDGARVGGIFRTSVWRRHMEVFRWSPKGDELMLEFPQVNRTIPIKAQARACDEAPDPMDLCLDVTILKKSVRLYSKKDWKRKDAADIESLVAELPIQPDAEGVSVSVDLQGLLE